MEAKTIQNYKKSGFAGQSVGAIVTLIVGVGVATLVLIFVGTLGGQTYNVAENDINNISDSTIKTSVQNSIKSGFSALESTGDYLPLIVLAVVITLVMALVLSLGNMGGFGGRGGSAL